MRSSSSARAKPVCMIQRVLASSGPPPSNVTIASDSGRPGLFTQRIRPASLPAKSPILHIDSAMLLPPHGSREFDGSKCVVWRGVVSLQELQVGRRERLRELHTAKGAVIRLEIWEIRHYDLDLRMVVRPGLSRSSRLTKATLART